MFVSSANEHKVCQSGQSFCRTPYTNIRAPEQRISNVPHRHRVGVMQPPSDFPRITGEHIGRSLRNLVYLPFYFEQLYIFPENFKTVPSMTFDLAHGCDPISNVMSNEICVPYRFKACKLPTSTLLLVMCTGLCCEVTFMVCTDIVTFPRSTESRDQPRPVVFDDVICHF